MSDKSFHFSRADLSDLQDLRRHLEKLAEPGEGRSDAGYVMERAAYTDRSREARRWVDLFDRILKRACE